MRTKISVRHITPGLGAVPADPMREPCSGVVGAALGIAEAQARLGYKSQLLGWAPDPDNTNWKIGAVDVHVTRGWRWARLPRYDFSIVAPLIQKSARLGAVDVVHVQADPHLLLSPGSGFRVLHLQTPTRSVPRSWHRLLRRADAVVCCSNYIRNQFLELSGYPEARTFTVHNGVDLSRFDVNTRMKTRERLGLAQDMIAVLFAGAVVPEKGLLELVRALAGINVSVPFELLVAGSGALWALPGEHRQASSYTERVRQASENLPVRWLGQVARDRMPAVYAAADIMVVPSVWDEPFGMVAVEGMAAGKPVIASRTGGLSEIVVDGESGFLVDPGSSSDLARAMVHLLENERLRQTMGANARRRATSFTWGDAAVKLEQIYEGSILADISTHLVAGER